MKLSYLLIFFFLSSSILVYGQDTLTLTPEDSSIYTLVEQMPEFNGGNQALRSYLFSNLDYPSKAIDNKIQGKVLVKFVVNEDGSITQAKVVKGLSPECDAEALRVIRKMPKWKPGKQNGQPVKVYYTQPIVYTLD